MAASLGPLLLPSSGQRGWLAFRSREPRADVSHTAAAAPYFGKFDIWLLLPSFGALLPRLPSVPVVQSMGGSGWGWAKGICTPWKPVRMGNTGEKIGEKREGDAKESYSKLSVTVSEQSSLSLDVTEFVWML